MAVVGQNLLHPGTGVAATTQDGDLRLRLEAWEHVSLSDKQPEIAALNWIDCQKGLHSLFAKAIILLPWMRANHTQI